MTQVEEQEEGRGGEQNVTPFCECFSFFKEGMRLMSYSINCKIIKETDFGAFFTDFWLTKVM